jgi:hypothetical protein
MNTLIYIHVLGVKWSLLSSRKCSLKEMLTYSGEAWSYAGFSSYLSLRNREPRGQRVLTIRYTRGGLDTFGRVLRSNCLVRW